LIFSSERYDVCDVYFRISIRSFPTFFSLKKNGVFYFISLKMTSFIFPEVLNEEKEFENAVEKK